MILKKKKVNLLLENKKRNKNLSYLKLASLKILMYKLINLYKIVKTLSRWSLKEGRMNQQQIIYNPLAIVKVLLKESKIKLSDLQDLLLSILIEIILLKNTDLEKIRVKQMFTSKITIMTKAITMSMLTHIIIIKYYTYMKIFMLQLTLLIHIKFKGNFKLQVSKQQRIGMHVFGFTSLKCF